MASLQKASLSFQTVVEVRDRLVSAYQEIMNMQVWQDVEKRPCELRSRRYTNVWLRSIRQLLRVGAPQEARGRPRGGFFNSLLKFHTDGMHLHSDPPSRMPATDRRQA